MVVTSSLAHFPLFFLFSPVFYFRRTRLPLCISSCPLPTKADGKKPHKNSLKLSNFATKKGKINFLHLIKRKQNQRVCSFKLHLKWHIFFPSVFPKMTVSNSKMKERSLC